MVSISSEIFQPESPNSIRKIVQVVIALKFLVPSPKQNLGKISCFLNSSFVFFFFFFWFFPFFLGGQEFMFLSTVYSLIRVLTYYYFNHSYDATSPMLVTSWPWIEDVHKSQSWPSFHFFLTPLPFFFFIKS